MSRVQLHLKVHKSFSITISMGTSVVEHQVRRRIDRQELNPNLSTWYYSQHSRCKQRDTVLSQPRTSTDQLLLNMSSVCSVISAILIISTSCGCVSRDNTCRVGVANSHGYVAF